MNNLGTVYDSMKQYKAAVKMYRKALKVEPKSALVLKNLGTDLLAQHDYKKGWEVYKQALALDPQIFDRNNGPRIENPASVQERGAMNYYMAKGCARAGKSDRAVEYLRMAIDEGFTNARKVAADQEFASLRGLPAFDQLICRAEGAIAPKAANPRSRGFGAPCEEGSRFAPSNPRRPFAQMPRLS